MKILVLLIALVNVMLFMWEYRQGAFEQGNKASQQLDREQIVLVSELKSEVVDVDFTSLYPPGLGLDPLANNFLTGPAVLEDFASELSVSAEPQNETIASPKP